ncbi:hypothetical protein [Kitasatospora sp. NPDC096140]|uniref:hypothetical protein n=1 Tax=Kitasatospora sp. NPDC096140 TaxID=3155425 RepID=UPI003325D1A2
MRAGQRGPAPPPSAAVLRVGALRTGVLRTGVLRVGVVGLTGVGALFAGGAVPAAADSLITVVDNSHADSWLEVDRTANLQNGSGSAGSDHDGAGSLVGGLLGPGSAAGRALRPVPGGGP